MTTPFQFVTDDHRMISETVERLFADLSQADAAQRLRDGTRLDAANVADALASLGLMAGAEPEALMTSAQVQAQVALAAGTACLAYPVLETLLVQALGASVGHGIAGVGVGTAPDAVKDASGGLAGTVSRMAFAEHYAQMLIPVGGATGVRYALIDRDTTGVALRARTSVEPDYPLHDVTLSVVGTAAVTVLGDTAAAVALDRRANLLAAAEIAGACRTMVRMTREHLLGRTQFGQPLGAYQALKHRLADAHVQAEALAWTVAYAAAASDGGDDEAGAMVAGAKLFAGNAGKAVAEAAMQLHGAIGYTVEFPLHLYMRRALRLGSSFDARDALEVELLRHFTHEGVLALSPNSGERS